MTGTITDHPLVRDYLRKLDVASRVLPAAQARELREQITGHLDEALPPGADDEEIAAALSRLGPPGSLASEAMARGSGTVPGTDAPGHGRDPDRAAAGAGPQAHLADRR